MINQVLIEYQGTDFNWWGKQLVASCLFEVIILGLFPSASWEEAVSLVQMLFVRSQNGEAASQHATEEIQANWNRTMALPSLYPISQGTMLSLWHFSTHTKLSHASVAMHCTHLCDILVPFALKSGKDEPLHSLKWFAPSKGFVCINVSSRAVFLWPGGAARVTVP